MAAFIRVGGNLELEVEDTTAEIKKENHSNIKAKNLKLVTKMETDNSNNENKKEEEEKPQVSKTPMNFVDVEWLKKAYEKSASVCKITAPNKNELTFGTGFLVANTWIFTNNHVIDDKKQAEKAMFEFGYENSLEKEVKITHCHHQVSDAFYTNKELDFTILKIKIPKDQVIPSIPIPQNREFKELCSKRCNVIGHPQGQHKKIGVQNNTIQIVNDKFLRYTTDTLPGMSGSPLFDGEWNLIGIHHASIEKGPIEKMFTAVQVRNNEGIRFDVILLHLQDKKCDIYEEVIKEVVEMDTE